jgi:hypothetical protein
VGESIVREGGGFVGVAFIDEGGAFDGAESWNLPRRRWGLLAEGDIDLGMVSEVNGCYWHRAHYFLIDIMVLVTIPPHIKC